MNQQLIKYIQFCIVGFSGMAVDMFFLWLLVDVFSWNLTLSKVSAAELALLNNFLWNDYWTFKKESISGDVKWIVRLLKFHLICLVGMALSVVLLNVFVFGLGWGIYISNFLAIVISSFWNYFMNLKWNWKGCV